VGSAIGHFLAPLSNLPMDSCTTKSTRPSRAKPAVVYFSDAGSAETSSDDSSCDSPDRKWKAASTSCKMKGPSTILSGKKTKKARLQLKARMTASGARADRESRQRRIDGLHAEM